MNDELEALSGVYDPKFKDFWSWVKKTFTFSYQDEIEHYLADSVDFTDFEQRTKVLRYRGML